MKAKKIAALLLASSMALSLVACGGKQATQTDSTSATEAEETAAAEDAAKEEPAEEAASEVSIDFEDGVFGFVGNDKTVNSAAGDSTFSVEDYNGGKALKITSSGKAIYAGIQADALLGDKASELKTVEMEPSIPQQVTFTDLPVKRTTRATPHGVFILKPQIRRLFPIPFPMEKPLVQETIWYFPWRMIPVRIRVRPLQTCMLQTSPLRMHPEMFLQQILLQNMLQQIPDPIVPTSVHLPMS
mgnify:CR=1 FL=1